MKQRLVILFCYSCLASYGQVTPDAQGNAALDSHESALLNEYFRDSRGAFDFTGKRICFVTGPSGGVFMTRKDYFDQVKQWNEDSGHMVTTLHVLTGEEKLKSGGYDALVTAWVKVLTDGRRRKIIRALGKHP